MTSDSDRSAAAALAMARLDALAVCTDEPGRITRLAFSPALARANALTLGWMRAAGLDAGVDAAGNVVGRYESEPPGAPALMLGSHLDSVRDAGRFDGPLGVVAAIAVVERLRREGRRLPAAIETIAFADEEGVRFGGTVLGSAAVAGSLRPNWRTLRDDDGITAEQALRDFGLDPDRVNEASRRRSTPVGYLELHIEQGPALEAADAPLGCVTAIAGATRAWIVLTGANPPFGETRGALAAAAECALAVERLCTERGMVGAAGRWVSSAAGDGMDPGEVAFTVDVRAPDDESRRETLAQLKNAFAAIAERRGVRCAWRPLSDSSATTCAPALTKAIRCAIADMGLPAVSLPSGAGHDGVEISAIAPVGMVFVRCAGGVSHNPLESASETDVALGLEALYRAAVACAAGAITKPWMAKSGQTC